VKCEESLSFTNILKLVSKASLPILVFLLEYGESNFSTIRKHLQMNEKTIYYGLDRLKSFELVSYRKEGNERLISLTSHGKIIAQKVRELEELLEKIL